MKVVIDTKYDTLDHAIATVRSAYGVPGAEVASPGAPAAPVRKRRNTKAMNPTSNISPRGESDKIRAWARDNGHEVKESGRMPAAVIRAYQEAQAAPADQTA